MMEGFGAAAAALVVEARRLATSSRDAGSIRARSKSLEVACG
jgi:hypothetical protein